MRFTSLPACAAIALIGTVPALAQINAGGAVAGAVGGVPTVPGTLVPDTTADAVRMSKPVAGVTARGNADASEHATKTTKPKHRKHKNPENPSAGGSATATTTAGAGTNAGMTTDAGAGSHASTGAAGPDADANADINAGASAGTTPRN